MRLDKQTRNWAVQLVWRPVAALLLLSLLFATSAAPVMAKPAIFENFVVQVDDYYFNECAADGAGEYIRFTGNMHVLFFETYSKSGNAVYKSQVNPQGLTGIGEVTGIRYQGTGMSQGISTVKDVNDVYTSINNMNFIAPGSDDNFVLHSTFHVTVNANGELTGWADNFVLECH